MRVMVLIKANEQTETGALPPPAFLAAIGEFNEALADAGVLLAADGLLPSSKGKRVCFDGEQRAAIDGPFAEPKDLIASYWIWQVRSLDEAVEWLKRAPFGGRVEIEVRPIMELEDFAEAITPEAREQHARTWEKVDALQRLRHRQHRPQHLAPDSGRL